MKNTTQCTNAPKKMKCIGRYLYKQTLNTELYNMQNKKKIKEGK